MARRMCEVDVAQRMRKVLLYEPVQVKVLGIEVALESVGVMHMVSKPGFYDEEEIRELAEIQINELHETALRYNDQRRTGLASIRLNFSEQFNPTDGNDRATRLPFLDIATNDWMPTISFNSPRYDHGLVMDENYAHVPVDPLKYSSWEELVEDNSDLFLKFLAMVVIKEIKINRPPNLRGRLSLYYENNVAQLRWHDNMRDTYDVELSDMLNKDGKLSIRALRKFVYDKRSKTPRREIKVPRPFVMGKITATDFI